MNLKTGKTLSQKSLCLMYASRLSVISMSFWKENNFTMVVFSLKIGSLMKTVKTLMIATSIDGCTQTLLHETNKVAAQPAHGTVLSAPLL